MSSKKKVPEGILFMAGVLIGLCVGFFWFRRDWNKNEKSTRKKAF